MNTSPSTISLSPSERPWLTLPPTPELPAAEWDGWTPVDGSQLWHAHYGWDRPGTPVLLLHGGLASSNYYAHLIPALVARGHRVLAVDSRGQGRSTTSGAPYSYRSMACDVVGLLSVLGLAAADIVGWSDGGIVGLEMAMHHPTRVHRLFTFGTNVQLSGLHTDMEQSPVFAAYLERTQEEFKRLSTTPQACDDTLRDIMTMWSSEPNYSDADLARITAPVTLAHAQYDEGIRADHVLSMAGSIPGANLVVLPNVSHFAMLQRPEQFNDAVIAFLNYR